MLNIYLSREISHENKVINNTVTNDNKISNANNTAGVIIDNGGSSSKIQRDGNVDRAC